jgi:PIN domain nuclease of toxin-antitoxin system
VVDVVLDTHACIYALSAPARLGRAARRVLQDAEAGGGTVWIPAAVIAEVVLLRELGRARIGLPELKAAIDQASPLRFLPLDLRQLDEFAVLVALRDPFDRLIVSACRAVNAHLVSRDDALQATGLVQIVWS